MKDRWPVHLMAGMVCLITMLMAFSREDATHGQADTHAAGGERHSLWVHPPGVVKTPEAVQAFIDQWRRAHIDTIIILVKGMNGEIYWNSRKFPQAVVKGYDTFDMLGTLIGQAHAQGIKVHAWLCDFVEGVNGAAFKAHPEWAELNPAGGTTATETLGPRKRPYPYVWMCQARRPGYVDQWLLPMVGELVRTFPLDGIHHDYVRYPGDVAPDSYCFCDYCLTHIPRYAMLNYETHNSERMRVDPRQERIEANWWTDPTMTPASWETADRRERANFLLNGQSAPGGPADVRYFFYEYRVEQIACWVREAHDLVKRINPKVEMSASVFKNPVQSARFLGQQWHRWTDWIDLYTPMTYRSHFSGSFEDYTAHLEETTRRQIEWTRHLRPIEAGIATTYLYREELKPIDDMTDALDVLSDLIRRTDDLAAANRMLNAAVYVLQGASGDVNQARARALKEVNDANTQLQQRLSTLSAADRGQAIAARVTALNAPDAASDAANDKAAADAVAALRRDLPAGFCPPRKLLESIEAARRARPDGIAIFAASSLVREKLWPTLEQAFNH